MASAPSQPLDPSAPVILTSTDFSSDSVSNLERVAIETPTGPVLRISNPTKALSTAENLRRVEERIRQLERSQGFDPNTLHKRRRSTSSEEDNHSLAIKVKNII